MSKREWYVLDNAAKIFPSTMTKRYTTVFRMSATLDHPVSVVDLQAALDAVLPRFPLFHVTLRRGMFWYYWERTDKRPLVGADSQFPCRKIPLLKRGVLPFRVRAYHHRVAVEFAHAITDGTGALYFLRALVAEYLAQRGVTAEDYGDIPRPGEPVSDEESMDGYLNAYKKGIPHPEPVRKAFHLPIRPLKKREYRVVTGRVSLKSTLAKAKSYGVSLTEYLAATLITAELAVMRELPRARKRPIRIIVPINLRKIYGVRTFRNFFLSVMPGIDPRLGEFTFGEILRKVHHYMRFEVDEKFTNRQITRNVEGELRFLNRIFPLFVKDLILSSIYRTVGQNPATCSLSNIGPSHMPRELAKHIRHFDFIPPPGGASRVDCAVVSHQDVLSISFGKTIADTRLEYRFFRVLMGEGIRAAVETNVQ